MNKSEKDRDLFKVDNDGEFSPIQKYEEEKEEEDMQIEQESPNKRKQGYGRGQGRVNN